MNYSELVSALNEYNKLNKELEQFEIYYSEFKENTEKEMTEKYKTLSMNIQRFCGNESFRSVIKNFCYLYSGILSVSGGNLAYKGVVPSPQPITCDNAFVLAEQSVGEIKKAFKSLAQKNSNAEEDVKKLCLAFITLRVINTSCGALKIQNVKKALELEKLRAETIRKKLDSLLTEFPELKTPEIIEKQISGLRKVNEKEVYRFNFKDISTPTDYGMPISLPIAINDAKDRYETGIVYWNPLNDGILHINIPCGRYEIASEYVIGLTMQFLYSYPGMKKQILYCCQNSLSRMDNFLKILKDVCHETIFFNGIEQIESDVFYQKIGECLKSLRTEVKRRSNLMDASFADDIYEYNSIEAVDIISPVLVFLHDYPTGFSGCRDLGYFFRECARYGIFFVVIQTWFGENYMDGYCEPSKYRGITCELQEDGQHILIGSDLYSSVFVEKTRILQLLSELMVNSGEENKNTYLSYESIGFGKTDRNADGYCTKISIPIGKVDNKVFSLDFATSISDEDRKKGIKTPLAYLVVGGPGSGKSTLIDSLIINGSMAYSPDDLIFYLLDFKDGVTASFYDGKDAIPHVRMIAAQSKEEDSDIILSGLISEKERRNELIKACGAADISGYNGKTNKKMPRIIVIVDECQNLFANDMLATKCERLAREGRSSGIHLVLASQDAKLNMMQHAGKFIDGRFCFFTSDKSDASQVINHNYTKALAIDVPKGSGFAWMSLENGENCEKIQIAFHGGDKSGNKAEYNKAIREKWGKYKYSINLIKAGENRPLMIDSYKDEDNPLMRKSSMVANIGENYFDHSIFEIDFAKDSSHSILLLGDNEKPSSDILTSIITGAISTGGEIKLIDESIDMSLSNLFASHPRVTSYTKDEYLTALSEVNEEFEQRKQNFRIKYKPYFFIINSLYRIDDYYEDKILESKNDVKMEDYLDDDNPFAALREAKYAQYSSSESKISGKGTLLSMLINSASVGNIYIIIATNSNIGNDYDERKIFSNCGYKILQKDSGAAVYQIMDNSFDEKMMSGLNENIVFISQRGSFSKCRYFQYDWGNQKTKNMVIDAVKNKSN